jgi:glycosyltransferase involved in cell wall biosynthesis
MCTYNGERFLPEQLASFLLQQCPPDELVVCDDCSKDNTVSILENFASIAPFPVRIHRNKENLGYKKNFEKAACLCQGDIIVFSDQDDVWLPYKTAEIKAIFESKPEISFVFSDATIVDENLSPLGYSFLNCIHFNNSLQDKFCQGYALNLLLKDLVIFGMLLAFRSSFRKYVFPLPEYWSHDGWLPIILSAISDFMIISKPLLLYRQHSLQFTGKRPPKLKAMIARAKRTGKEEYLNTANIWISALKRLSLDPELCENKLYEMIKEKIKHLIVRAELPNSLIKRLSLVIEEAISLRYFRYSNGWKSVAKDICMR